VLYATHRAGNQQMSGVFCVGGQGTLIQTDVPDGCLYQFDR
jgi:hypothetical protein